MPTGVDRTTFFDGFMFHFGSLSKKTHTDTMTLFRFCALHLLYSEMVAVVKRILFVLERDSSETKPSEETLEQSRSQGYFREAISIALIGEDYLSFKNHT